MLSNFLFSRYFKLNFQNRNFKIVGMVGKSTGNCRVDTWEHEILYFFVKIEFFFISLKIIKNRKFIKPPYSTEKLLGIVEWTSGNTNEIVNIFYFYVKIELFSIFVENNVKNREFEIVLFVNFFFVTQEAIPCPLAFTSDFFVPLGLLGYFYDIVSQLLVGAGGEFERGKKRRRRGGIREGFVFGFVATVDP